MRVRVPCALVALGFLFAFLFVLLIERVSEYGILCKFLYIWRLRSSDLWSYQSDSMWTHSHRTEPMHLHAEQEWKEEPKCCARMVSNRRKIMRAFGWHRRKVHGTVKVLCSHVLIICEQPGILSRLSWVLCAVFPASPDVQFNSKLKWWIHEVLGVRVPRIKFNAFPYHIRSLSWLSMRKIDGPDLVYFHIVLFGFAFALHIMTAIWFWELSHTLFVLGWRFHAGLCFEIGFF